MTKEERSALAADENYFKGVLGVLTRGLFTGENAQVILALGQVTQEKLKTVQTKLEDEAKRIEDMLEPKKEAAK